ncbi:phosphoribosyltransferase [Pseudomonas sp. TMB3-21]
MASNRPKPAWFDAAFQGTKIIFIPTDARQNGNVIKEAATHLKIQPYDVLVLAGKTEDMQMAKNGQAILIAAGWATDRTIQALGIKVSDGAELESIVGLTHGWTGHWWYKGEEPKYHARALADLSGYGRDITATQQNFARKLTATVKSGGTQLTALSLLASRSLLIDGIYGVRDLLWGVYPSSQVSVAGDNEVLSDFTHRLRTTVSLARFAKRDEPLFIRHAASEKRSLNRGADRSDPTDQITSMHLNPEYKSRLRGRNVIIVDDCTTHGLSFGVAAAFLRAGGAISVTGIALGKFGNTMKYFDIVINSDPFKPVKANQFTSAPSRPFTGVNDSRAQQSLITLIP